MTRVVVDSSVWIDLLRGERTRQTAELERLVTAGGGGGVLVADLVLAEVLRGLSDEKAYRKARGSLLAFEAVTVGGAETAIAAAEHYRALRRLGITVRSTVDCLVAAWCISHDVPLLHDDRDFLPFAEHRGLRLHPV